MKNKVILDLCGGTGAWSRPYAEAGYDVRVITLPEYDVTKVEFGNYAMHFMRQDVHYMDCLIVLYEDVYGILAAPPCTEFSIAKGNTQRDFKGAMKIVQACLKIIWECRMRGNLKFWALENPRGFLRQFLGKPQYTFKHWYFEEDTPFIKPTDLWGYYNKPTQTNFKRPTREIRTNHAVLYGNPECPKEYEHLNKLPYDERRAAIRAITPPGFAKAFHKVNK